MSSLPVLAGTPCSRALLRLRSRVLLAAAGLLLVACGGGGGSSSVEVQNLSGVAAVGQAIVDGTVTARCVSGTPESGVRTAASGAYRLRLQGAQPPCLLQVSGGSVGGQPNSATLHGYAAQPGTAALTPFTELQLARAFGQDPATVFAAFGAGTTPPSATTLASAATYVADQLAALGLSRPSGDLLNGSFAVGDANDQLLDRLGQRLESAGQDVSDLLEVATTGGDWAPVVAPAACAAQAVSWTAGGQSCSATLAETAAGESALAVDASEPATGTARYSCSQGQWSGPAAASCTASSTQPTACAAASLNWTVGGNSCSGTAAATASGQSSAVVDSTGPATGLANFQCSNGQWGAALSATCSVPAASACSAAVLGWSSGANSCSASVPTTADGDSTVATDNQSPTIGSARFACGNGTWGAPTAVTCDVVATCPAQTLSWTVGAETCSAAVADTTAGGSVTASDTSLPTVGSAGFSCNAGTWSAASAAQCRRPPQGVQTLTLNLQANAGGRWIEIYSDSFAEIGQRWNGDSRNDGFFLYSRLPAYVPVGSGQDVFPYEGNWAGIGQIDYNLDGYNGIGPFSTGISGFRFNVAPFVAEQASVLNRAYDTVIQSYSGTVTLQDGRVTALTLVSPIIFSWSGSSFAIPGSFTITGAAFTLNATRANLATWDFSGQVTLP